MSKHRYVVLLVAILSGCASPAAIDQMTAKNIAPSKISAETPLKNNLSVKNVSGGQATNPMWLSKVGDDNFKQALEQSLNTALLLAPDANKSAYLLDVKLVSLEQPFAGLDLKVTATVEYSLQEKLTGEKVFTKTITTPFTATFGDAALAFVRLKIANEGAIRENIEKIIDELLALNISKQQVSVNGQ